MFLLCLDTSMPVLAAAVVSTDGRVLAAESVAARAQAVLSLVDRVVDASGIDAFDGVVVGTGPGGFTGLRIGIVTARGICETLGLPLVGIGSLVAAGFQHARPRPERTVWIDVDGQRGERFVQPLRADASGRVVALHPARSVPIAQVDDVVAGGIHERVDRPDAASLALAALQAWARDDDEPAPDGARARGLVVPTYGREPDATRSRIDVRIDELQRGDMERLLVLESRCFADPWTRAMYAEELDRPDDDAVRVAARDGDVLVGAALAARIGGPWHLLNVLVDPSARRRGIAMRLMHELLDRSRARGAEEGWVLEVRAGDPGATALYERCGFATIGMRPGYYQDTGEDARVMVRPAALEGHATLEVPAS